jgi:hypothetical protein
VLFRRARPWRAVWSGIEDWGARSKKPLEGSTLVRRTRALCKIEWSEDEVVKLVGVGTEAEEEVRARVGARIDGGKRWERGHEVGMGSGPGRTGRSAVNRAEFASCGRAVSWRSSDSFDPRPRYGACNWGVKGSPHESVPFCAYEKTTNLGKCSCGTAGRADSSGSAVPSCACEKPSLFLQVVDKIWRPRRDLNPCYRRERAQTNWITL